MPKEKVTFKQPKSNIKQLRDKQGLSQLKLAVDVGVTPNTIQNWENSKGLANIEKVIRLCKTLECTIEDLIEYVEVEIDEKTQQKSKGKGLSKQQIRELNK